MKKLLRPKILIPVVLSASLIVGLLSVSDLGKVTQVMKGFERADLAAFLLLIAIYEVIRGGQWIWLLRALNVRGPLEPEIFSFVLGEIAKSVPIGNYFQNYLLNRVEGEDIGRTSAASTLIILTEVAISIIAVLIIGIDGWGWLRPTIVIGLIVAALVAWTVHRIAESASAPDWLTEHKWVRGALEELRRFREGAADLMEPKTLVVEAALGALYLLAGGVALYVVSQALHVQNASFWQVLAVYFFSLGFGLIFPLPTDIGVAEVSGVGAFMAFGVDRNIAVSVMIVNRLLNIGASLVIALVSMAFMRTELKKALSERKQQPGQRVPAEASSA